MTNSEEQFWMTSVCGAFIIAALAGPLLAQAPADDVKARIRAFETGLRPSSSVSEELDAQWTIRERMAYYRVPGMSIAVIRNGKVTWAKGYGLKLAGTTDSVDTETVFSVGSVSKVGTAAATLRLVDQGKLDLDRNVNDYLSRWKVPQNELTADRPVTLRRIMSHTAGLTVHGFADFQPGESLPTVIDILEGRAPAKSAPVRVDLLPGTRYRYSGGGTTVEQLVIEEVTSLDFPAATRTLVFDPLGMTRSTYQNPLPAVHGNIAKAHGGDGEPRALPRGWEAMPEMAASGLWTTPSDLARLVIAFIESYQGGDDTFISTGLAREMMTQVEPSLFGLGPHLETGETFRVFFHGGSNDSYKAYMEGDLISGNGVVVLTNGANGRALGREVRVAVAYAEGWEFLDGPERAAAEVRLLPIELMKAGRTAAILEAICAENASRAQVNSWGYELLSYAGRAEQAVAVFRLNTGRHPASTNVWDSLADGYLAAADSASAIEAYLMVLKTAEVDQESDSDLVRRLTALATRQLARLRGTE